MRSVTISKSTYQDLLLLKIPSTQNDHFVFQSQKSDRLSADRVRELITEATLKAGITKRVSPHWFRHAHAMHSYKNGVQLHVLQKTLGHAYISTTGLYLDSLPEETSGDYLDI